MLRATSTTDFHMEITPLGDSALIVRVRDQFRDAPAQTVDQVLAVMARIERAEIPGILELAPAYTTVAVYFDPARAIAGGANPDGVVEWLTEKVSRAVGHSRRLHHIKSENRSIEVPMCCDSEFAFDLEQLAQHSGMSAAEAIDLCCAAEFVVNCLGFTPGFPFLSGLPQRLAMPRRATPRKEIPAGSVAVGGEQAGIYPIRSPGGWNVIGRTPMRLFDSAKNPPALFRIGDRVHFRLIARDEFERSMS